MGVLAAASLWPTGAGSAPAGPQVLRNGGFERDGAWTFGQFTRVVGEEPRSGNRCLRADGAQGAAAEQTVWAVEPGKTYTAAGWMRTREIVPQAGGFAFIALYEHDAAGRIVRFTDFAKVTGTNPWSKHRHSATLAPTTEYVVVRIGIHSALGTAWFDDISLTPGETAQPWKEPADGATRPREYRAAILEEPALPIIGKATPASVFRKALARERIPLTPLSAADLSSGAPLADRFDLLIVPTGATFPVEGRKALLAFLMAGGDLLCTGGYAFDNLVIRDGGRWAPYRERLDRLTARARDKLIPNGGLEAGTEGWEAEGPACSVDDAAAASGSRSGRVRLEAAGGGSRWTRELAVEPGRTYLIGATARCEDVQGSHFAFLAVYQYDAEGKLLEFKDFAQMTGTRDWTRHEARIVIHPGAKRVLFHAGLYLAAGTLWFDDVTCAPLPAEERINAHFGEPRDGLVITPVQLTLFSPDQPLAGARAVGVWPGWRPLTLDGEIRGCDATAQLRQSARWQPIVECRDRFGRMSGAVGSLVTHVSGPFGGSRWALFGVTNRDIFAGPFGEELLRRTARLLAHPVAARSLTTDYAIYEPGEEARIRLVLHSPRGHGRLTRSGGRGGIRSLTVTLTLDAPGRSPAAIHAENRNLAPGSELPVSLDFLWKVPRGAPDFIRAQVAVADAAGETLDWIETGFCIRDEKVVASGTRIAYRDNAFDLTAHGKAPTRTTLFGTDTYGNMLLSPSCSPLTWYRDLKAMRDHGLHMYENLQYPPTGWKYTEAEWRRMDALIQLSQRFGLPYMAGLLVGADVAVDDATLQAQADMCRSFATRYRRAPGLIYYLNGDFRLDMKDIPDLRRLWNEQLTERYGSDEALRKAWGSEAVPEPLGKIRVANHVSTMPFSRRAHDVKLFQASLVHRWVSTLTSAIREADGEHPITSEYYQRPIAGIDLRLTMDGMDAANFGYFGGPRDDIAQLLATIKWNDMRRAGQTINIGEFGVKTHDAWAQERDPFGYHIGRTEEEQRRQLWWIVHAAMAYDVTKIQNWCWADDPDSVFPWGVAYKNPMRPKPVLRLWRNLRFLSELMPHAYAPAPVVFIMPDSWRLGAPEPEAWRGIAGALHCLLATGVRFDLLNENQVASLAEGSVRLALAPFASNMSRSLRSELVRLAEGGATVYTSAAPADSPPRGGSEPITLSGGASWTRTALGAGAIVASPDAWEAMPGFDVFVRDPEVAADPNRNLFLQLVRLAGVEPDARVEASEGIWRATVRQAEGRTLIAAFPAARDGSLTVRNGGNVAEWTRSGRTDGSGGWPCLVVLDQRGGVLGATGRGRLTVNGRVVADGQGPWMLASLDGRPLDRSSRFAVSTTNGGALRISSSIARPSARIVELREGKVTPVGSAIVTRRGKLIELLAPANELTVVAE